MPRAARRRLHDEPLHTDTICMKCAGEERQHPDYRMAADAELAAVRSGDRNFPGIGWPGKNGRVKR